MGRKMVIEIEYPNGIDNEMTTLCSIMGVLCRAGFEPSSVSFVSMDEDCGRDSNV